MIYFSCILCMLPLNLNDNVFMTRLLITKKHKHSSLFWTYLFCISILFINVMLRLLYCLFCEDRVFHFLNVFKYLANVFFFLFL